MGVNINRGKRRKQQAQMVADMLLSMRSDSRSVKEMCELTGMHRESLVAWLEALADVGVIVEGARRKIHGKGGNPARTWYRP